MPVLNVIVPFLAINDYLKPQRYEWILGIPFLKMEKPTYQLNPSFSSYKVGVGLSDRFRQDIVEYRSTAFKVNNISVKESLLQIFYQYRMRWIKQSLLIAQGILRIMKFEQTDYMYRYLTNLDPPSYEYARYIDWIIPYLKE